MLRENFYYIVFLLGSDSFKICDFIREQAKVNGMDGIFEDCHYIAKQFEEFDDQNEFYKTHSLYDTFEIFLNEYDEDIRKYFTDGTKFELKEF